MGTERRTRTPKYLQINDQLTAMIADMEPDTLLPKELELAETFSVSRETLRQALQLQTSAGRIYSIKGKGTFVARPHISKGDKLTSFTEDMEARGLTPRSRVISAREITPDTDTAHDLELDDGRTVFEIVRIRLADDVPMCLETFQTPTSFFPTLLELPLTGSIYELFRTHGRISITNTEQRITAALAKKAQADLLGVRPRSPVLLVNRVSSDQRGRLIERTESVYRGDRYDFRLSARRDGR
ncbi:GntR family transcriptional regulator [Phytoactinopolyspora limicola]|uniref:GntR family transcriptional regulator n=1 Tax=Phytoactinopolyspora limicola TaxID=2715536 RepID=UPI00140A3192|nr:GntR family transcriptional regulator [Phytoactinopolyspora limicola]